jgi:hypothetical protein
MDTITIVSDTTGISQKHNLQTVIAGVTGATANAYAKYSCDLEERYSKELIDTSELYDKMFTYHYSKHYKSCSKAVRKLGDHCCWSQLDKLIPPDFKSVQQELGEWE